MAGSPRVQLSLKGRLLSEVSFAGPQLRIGRMRENDVVVNNLAVSRFHAVLRRDGDGFVLEDLGSENGTLLNGARVAGSAPITATDVISLGKYELRLVLQPGVQIAGAPKAKAKPSDAWDASQTFLALDPPPAVSPKPAAAPSPLAAAPAFSPSPLAAKPAPAPAPTPALALEEAEEELELPMLDALELESEPEAEPAAAAEPDPDGVFAFGEDEVASPGDDAVAGSEPAIEAAPLTTPNREHTSLFDFGSPAEPAGPEEIPAEFVVAPEAAAVAPPVAPAEPRVEALTVYAGVIVQRDGKLHSLRAWEEGDLCAGRAPECEIVLADAGVSRRHAVFTRSGDLYGVRDLESVNGIYVNGQRTKQHELAVGDVVRIESFELTFVLDHSPIGSGVSGPTPAAAKPQELARATQFSLEAPAREHKDGFELMPLASDSTEPHGSEAESPSFDETTDGFEVLPPADDPMAAEAETAEPVLALDLPESDLVSAEGIDDDEEKDATVQGKTGAQALREAARATRGAPRMRLVLDTSQLSARARDALAVLADEGVELSARLSFARE
jgi:pSer/pThr/pTyr-binding forkhead associated (FHA) protein